MWKARLSIKWMIPELPVIRHLPICGVFTLVLTKHGKHLTLVDIPRIGVDPMQRNFEPMRSQVDVWK